MRPPIFLWEANDLMVFDSVEKAEACIEPPDVDVGIAFDADGRLLSVESKGRRTFVRESESTPTHGEHLRAVIREALNAVGLASDPCTPLDDLIREAASRFRV